MVDAANEKVLFRRGRIQCLGAWRIQFLFSFLLVFVTLYMRANFEESRVYADRCIELSLLAPAIDGIFVLIIVWAYT
jgi:hypothetical protein